MTLETAPFDAIVVGGGPAGLSAAIWLARFRRRVLVLDTASPRNRATWAVHGYPGLSDLSPDELRRRLRDQALGAGAELEMAQADAVEGERDRFRVRTARGGLRARRLLLAYGLRDVLPDVPGLGDVLGTVLFHCPDCDGPSMAGAVVGVIGHDRPAAALALYLLSWADRVELLTHGAAAELGQRERRSLEEHAIPVHESRIREVRAGSTAGAEIRLETGENRLVDGLFSHTGSDPASDIAALAGCRFDDDGHVHTDRAGQTSVPGIFAAGDLTGHPHLAIAAAAEGVTAALAIHRSLLPESLRLRGA